MQEYVPAPGGEEFTQARECYGELEEWLAGQAAAGLQHAELEDELGVRGRELLRWLFQGHLDLLAAREVRRHDVTGEDGIARTRAEKGRARLLVTKFGQVTVSRIAYRAPAAQLPPRTPLRFAGTATKTATTARTRAPALACPHTGPAQARYDSGPAEGVSARRGLDPIPAKPEGRDHARHRRPGGGPAANPGADHRRRAPRIKQYLKDGRALRIITHAEAVADSGAGSSGCVLPLAGPAVTGTGRSPHCLSATTAPIPRWPG
jgi:hypothetical protein